MQEQKYIPISIVSLLIALIFCALYNQWIIISIPHTHTIESSHNPSFHKKEITLHFFNNNKWHTEKQELLWSHTTAKNAYQLINAWLSLLDEESIVPKKVTLQTALLSHTGTLYLSFDNHLFTKENIIFKKWMIIEGLLKTLSENDISIQNVQFLVQHQPLTDYHLDFSLPWPAQGFLNSF